MSASGVLSGSPASLGINSLVNVSSLSSFPNANLNITLPAVNPASAAGVVISSTSDGAGVATTSLYLNNPTTAWRWTCGGSGAGGITQNHLQLFDYSNGVFTAQALDISDQTGLVSFPSLVQTGSGSIAIGQSSVVVNNAAVGAGSIIMVTPTSQNAAGYLAVTAKAAGSFTVTSAANAAVSAATFDYFIVKA